MKQLTLFFLLSLLTLGCSKEPNKKANLREQAFALTQQLQQGNLELIQQNFFSEAYYASFPNTDAVLKQYQKTMSTLQIGKKENIIIDTLNGQLNHPLLPTDSLIVFDCYVPLGVEMPSPVPAYYLSFRIIWQADSLKIIALDLSSTKSNVKKNTIKILNKISINKEDLVEADLMYEGGHNHPFVFKSALIKNKTNSPYQAKLDTIIQLLNRSTIIKSQREHDTRQFKGNPELGIITMKLENQYNWTIFHMIDADQTEHFFGNFELRYFQYLNEAVTYWIICEEEVKLSRLFLELCHLGKNKRTGPKESVRLELKKE